MTSWTIRFNPQIWDHNDYAVDVPPLGDDRFSVDDETARKAREVLDEGGYIDEHDELCREHPNCPEWIRTWGGTGYYNLWDPEGIDYKRALRDS
jgi:hypothetical protein